MMNGKIKLPTLQEPPKILTQLLNGQHDKTTMFLNNVRKVNAIFPMTSIDCNEVCEDKWMPTFNAWLTFLSRHKTRTRV